MKEEFVLVHCNLTRDCFASTDSLLRVFFIRIEEAVARVSESSQRSIMVEGNSRGNVIL